MWDYSENVMDHFRNPRNVGEIENADGVGQAGSLACGDALKLFLAIDETEHIADAKFQTFGCASAVASASALTEIIKGMSLDEAEKVSNQDIAAYLGGLPEQKMHCSVMGREALQAAIKNYRSGEKNGSVFSGEIVCTCFGVTDTEIEAVIRENSLSTVDQVTNYCKAGGGCGGCREDIQRILDRNREGSVDAAAQASPARRMTNLEKIRLVTETIEREIRPQLQRDGGDIELVDVVQNRVIVAFRGMCAGCSASDVTLKDVVQTRLREFVTDDLVVEEAEE
jgi:NifU-like protein